MDNTEPIRRELVAAINTNPPTDRQKAEAIYGQVWDTAELGRDYEVLGFLAPFVSVRRKSDRVKGLLAFQHSPRFYFDFQPE